MNHYVSRCLKDNWLVNSNLMVDEYDNVDSRLAIHQKYQRDDVSMVPRTIVDGEVVRTRDDIPADELDKMPEDTPDNSLCDIFDDARAAPRTDTTKMPAVAEYMVADSKLVCGKFYTTDRIADSTNGNNIPATWSQGGPGSRGGS